MPNQRYQKVASSIEDGTNNNNNIDNNNKMKIEKNGSSGSESGGSGLPSTHSSQQLIQGDTGSVTTAEETPVVTKEYTVKTISAKHWFTVGVLCFVNLINYMDRYTIAGVLDEIQHHFKLTDDQGGLLQTAFLLSYMICAPVFGYLGDRYSRRWIMILGVFLWSGTTLLGSFMNHFGWFLAFRAMVGIGEASYSTIAPTIISDLFVHNMRSRMLAMFYFAIPVGSGLGYIVGSETASALGTWRWALRVTPILGVIAVVLIFLTQDPERGQSEGTGNMEVTSYTEDLKDIVRNKSFMLSTAGFTCVAFVAGALAWWGPKFIYLGLKLQQNGNQFEQREVSFKFGVITMISGILGVPLGSYLSQRLIKQYPRIDPYICGMGLFISAPLFTLTVFLVTTSESLTYTCIFFGELALNLNWAIVADILLYVVIPTRRATAEAFQILVSHAFGDAGSPYLVGVISEALKIYFRNANKKLNSDLIPDNEFLLMPVDNSTMALTQQSSAEDIIQFQSLQYALLTTAFVEVIGGIMFLITAIYIVRDKTRAENAVVGCQLELSESSTSSEQITVFENIN